MKAKDAINFLKDYDPDEEVCMVLWTVPDVEERAEEMEIEVTPELTASVLAFMERKHDAEIGISWDTVDWTIKEIAARQTND
jgi:hypothetical protein